jgi:hypothetical protein
MHRARALGIAFLFFACCTPGEARPPTPVLQDLRATDRPWDRGSALVVTWSSSLPPDFVVQVERLGPGAPKVLGSTAVTAERFVDSSVSALESYSYELAVYDAGGNLVSTERTPGPVSPQANFFDAGRLGEALIIGFLFTVFIWGTFRKKTLDIRPLGGVAAMEEALGRAVEMGKPVLFSVGWGAQLDKPATLAALNLFGWLARRSAAYGARLIFPVHDAVIMAAAQESAREGARLEGRPDHYQEDNIYYVTGSQFGYAAAVDGVLWRSKPAANFWLGTFAAESLILAETGHQVGAVQIAGTDSTIQLAFFLVTCDYTLIGEEMFAASAYLSREPRALGALWAQDVLKVVVAVAILAGLLAGAFGLYGFSDYLRSL